MEINRKTYELAAFEYLEGNLSPADVAAFMAFLADNPDIARELELMDIYPYKAPEEENKVDFSFLKKNLSDQPVSEHNFEEFCIAMFEGDLAPEAVLKLTQYIEQSPARRKTFETYGKLKLEPDKNIRYFNKASLRHPEPYKIIRRILYGTAAAAASVTLILVLNYPGDEKPQLRLSYTPEKIIKTDTSKLSNALPQSISTETLRKTTSPKIPEKETASLDIASTIIDTSNTLFLAEAIYLKPIQGEIKESASPVNTILYQQVTIENNSTKLPSVVSQLKTRGEEIYLKASTMSLGQVISSGINGINKVAETDLKFQSKSDAEGNIVEFALSTDNFNFRRKTSRN
jgi:hypothetical protein